jgi:purine-binding chemotaxis protein CheW
MTTCVNASTLETSLETSSVQALAGKYLTFCLGEESYGIAVLKIREIIRLTTITAMPQMPGYVKGVINLRGKVIPVLDLRAKFGLGTAQASDHTCIVVVQVELPDKNKTLMGLMVDGVEEVIQIAPQEIEETPDFGANVSTEYILGMAKIKNAVKALLDIDKVVGAETTELAQAKPAF